MLQNIELFVFAARSTDFMSLYTRAGRVASCRTERQSVEISIEFRLFSPHSRFYVTYCPSQMNGPLFLGWLIGVRRTMYVPRLSTQARVDEGVNEFRGEQHDNLNELVVDLSTSTDMSRHFIARHRPFFLASARVWPSPTLQPHLPPFYLSTFWFLSNHFF